MTTDTRCDACLFDIDHEHGPAPRLFTFGLRYEWGIEEMDLLASSQADAKATARKVGTEVYEDGWTLVSLSAGGSGGLVTIY